MTTAAAVPGAADVVAPAQAAEAAAPDAAAAPAVWRARLVAWRVQLAA
jgi:hypothetical protein